MSESVSSRATPSWRTREESNVKGKSDEPKARGMAPMALGHVICCGALLLFVSGAATRIGGLLSGSGLAWIAGVVALAIAGVILWRRQTHRGTGNDSRHNQNEVGDNLKTRRSTARKGVV